MNTYRNIALTALVLTGFALLAQNAGAQTLVEKIRVTISEPVEVPGLVLPIGTYVFEALENGALTRILSADENHIYTTLSTVPDLHREPADAPAVTLKEAPNGDIERVDSWYFPGESIGNEFVYPKAASERNPTKISTFARDTVRVVPEEAKNIARASEFLAVHAEQAVVNSSVAVGHFFAARFLVI